MGDITYLPVGDGRFPYLATVLDCFSRRVVGYPIADHMRAELVADALCIPDSPSSAGSPATTSAADTPRTDNSAPQSTNTDASGSQLHSHLPYI